MSEFAAKGKFNLTGWLKKQDIIRKPRDDQWAEQQSEAAAVTLRNRLNIDRYERYKRTGGTLYDKKKDKTPT